MGVPDTHLIPEQGGRDLRYEEIRRVTIVGAYVNFVVAVVKLFAGLFGSSQALIADAVHSFSDLGTDFLVLWAAKHGSRAADEDHPYGHGRIETLATVILGSLLIIVAVGISWDAVNRLLHPENLLHPGYAALLVAFVSIFAKEAVYRYTIRVADKLDSALLRANAWHSRSDAIASFVAVVGIAGSMAGIPSLDAIAAIGVGLMIGKIGWDLAAHSAHELIDTGLDPERVREIRSTVLSIPDVLAVHDVRTRRMGGVALVDAHVLAHPKISVSEGHYISDKVRTRLIHEVPEVQDVLVHIDPEDDELSQPCSGLPSRREVIQTLRPHWERHIPFEKIGQITLHYLDGKVAVEVVLPLSAVADLDSANRLAELIAAPVKEFDHLSEISVSFHVRTITALS